MDKLELENIIIDLKSGFTDKIIANKYHYGTLIIKDIRSKYIGLTANMVRKLLVNPEFEDYFRELHNDSSKSTKEIVEILSNHPLFIRSKTINQQRISEIRKFYNIEPRMPENSYKNDYDRIRGYIIRNSKFTSKRRNIHFDLKYTDFELPKYCPILNIELKYMTESNGNSFNHATLDRIDNSKGYVPGNVIIISRLANAMKNQASFDQLELFSKNILKLITYYKNQGALGSITDVFDSFEPKLNLDS